MLHARLREIRKAKGMTLQQVADRIEPKGTTAQTIGRLETGVRTVSIDWVQRIALALDVDPGELLALPESADLIIGGAAGEDGRVLDGDHGVISLRLAAEHPIAITVAQSQGQYRQGDIIICNPLPADQFGRAVGLDCLVTLADGQRCLAKLGPGEADQHFSLLPLAAGGVVRLDKPVKAVAPAVKLVRNLAS